VLGHGRFAHAQTWLAEELRGKLERLVDGRRSAQMVGFVYEHAAIHTRYTELAIDELDERRDWVQLVNAANHAMASRVLAELAQRDGLADCEALIVASSSYYGFPALSRRLLEGHGLPRSALCFDLAGLGCAGPTHALALAHMLIEQGRCASACVLCVDAMSSMARLRRHTRPPAMSELVAHALASDGAAGLVLARAPGLAPLLSFERARLDTQLWSDSLDQNDLGADAENGPYLAVGKDIRTRLIDELGPLLDDVALREPLLVHPGGLALMRSLAEQYPALAPSVELSLSVLSGHGNLGASSLLWVLDAALARGVPLRPRLRLVALGPGIVTTCLTLEGQHEG
jgi:predicted naringenin-chalcone synthase